LKVYLLDTCVWSKWYKGEDYVVNNIETLRNQECRLMMSPITWGEFTYGWELDKTYRREEFLKFIDSIMFQFCKEIDKHAALIYGELRALLTDRYDPRRKNKKWIDAIEDPTTSQKLGVQENDLWITCQAINLGATLVTADKKMKHLFAIIPEKYIGDENDGFYPWIWGNENDTPVIGKQ